MPAHFTRIQAGDSEAQLTVADAVLAAHVKRLRIKPRDGELQFQDSTPVGIDAHVDIVLPAATAFGRGRRAQYTPSLVDRAL